MTFHSPLCTAMISGLLSVFLLGQAEAVDGGIDAFLKPSEIKIVPLFTDGRFPNIVLTKHGSLLGTWGDKSIRAVRSEDGGETWSEEITIAPAGIHGGGTTVDSKSGDIFVFVEAKHPPSRLMVYRSKDDGVSWEPISVRVEGDSAHRIPSMHMNEHGITLEHSVYAGRLIRPSRYYGQGNRPESLWPTHFTNAVYSDDGGLTWKPSEPFPEFGTGEAALVELSDGRIYYNTRRHWAPEGKNPRRRWHGWSDDGGATWHDVSICEILPDGPQNTNYGCMGGLTRLPIADKDLLVYSNCDDAGGRKNGTVWLSFDGGVTWPIKRLVESGPFAYSSLVAGGLDSPAEGWIYLHYESSGSKVARMNLRWIIEGDETGDGVIPAWALQLR